MLNQLKNLENFGLVEREGVSETIRQELPLPEFSSLSWSQPLCPYSALWSREAVESHHCYCPCLATGFSFFSCYVFQILHVRVSFGMSWVYNLSHCCGQCSSEHVCKNSLLLNVSHNCLMKFLKEIWPLTPSLSTEPKFSKFLSRFRLCTYVSFLLVF